MSSELIDTTATELLMDMNNLGVSQSSRPDGIRFPMEGARPKQADTKILAKFHSYPDWRVVAVKRPP